jgi:eukaryotic-like serine/threonine-protein kinase
VSSIKPAVPDPANIDKFQVVKTLGAGAMGTVYKAMDPDLGRFVAIKTIRLEGFAASQASLDDLVERFKREAKVAARLKHPNIVTIHWINPTPGNLYIVMEYVDGVGLDRVIKSSGRMSVERAGAIGVQVADALAYAHKLNVIHRDIKPANIMLEPGDHVKVADFGIAKATDMADHLTATGGILGTPSYMSPEQARGHQDDGSPIDSRSDLFSLGCILYEMVGGEKAFSGDNVTAILLKIIQEEPRPLHQLDPTVPDEMVRIIAKALAKKPKDRYQSGSELADDLRAVTRPGFVPTVRAAEIPTLPPADVPTIASPGTARPEVTIGSAPTTVRPDGPPPLPAAAGGPPTLPPTIVTPTARAETPAAAPRPAPRPSPPSPKPARRSGAGVGLLVGLALVAVLGLAVVVGGAWYLFGRTPRATAPSASPEAAQVAQTPAPAESTPVATTTTTAEAVPVPAAPTPTVVAAPAAAPAPVRLGSASRPQSPPTTPAFPPPPPSQGAEAAGPAAGDFTYLDELPSETPDGRAAGEALAQKYRSGGSTSYNTTRFRARALFPSGTTLAERPAVGTLVHLHQAEEAYHRKNGRYGSARELADAGFLRVDVPVSAEGFRRARYGFRVTAAADSYRADAVPLAANGRAFMVDDSGYVRFPE